MSHCQQHFLYTQAQNLSPLTSASLRPLTFLLVKAQQSFLPQTWPQTSATGAQKPYSFLALFAGLSIFWPPDVKSRLIGKDPDAGEDWGQEEKGTTEDEMVGWHRRLHGREFEQALGDGEGQGGLVCCSPRGHKEPDTTEWLNNNNNSSLLGFPGSTSGKKLAFQSKIHKRCEFDPWVGKLPWRRKR